MASTLYILLLSPKAKCWATKVQIIIRVLCREHSERHKPWEHSGKKGKQLGPGKDFKEKVTFKKGLKRKNK